MLVLREDETLLGNACDVKQRMHVECEQVSRTLEAPMGNPDASHEECSMECSVEALLMVLALADADAARFGSIIATFVTADGNFVVEPDLDQDGHRRKPFGGEREQGGGTRIFSAIQSGCKGVSFERMPQASRPPFRASRRSSESLHTSVQASGDPSAGFHFDSLGRTRPNVISRCPL